MSDATLALISAAIGAASGLAGAWIISRGSARKHHVDALAQEVGVLSNRLNEERKEREDLEAKYNNLRAWVKERFGYDPDTRLPVGRDCGDTIGI